MNGHLFSGEMIREARSVRSAGDLPHLGIANGPQ
jgi:hypothetical protein